MEKLIEQAKELASEIRKKQKEIDNPALVIGVLNELEFFIENVGDGEES